jgi:hypothetical protein
MGQREGRRARRFSVIAIKAESNHQAILQDMIRSPEVFVKETKSMRLIYAIHLRIKGMLK